MLAEAYMLRKQYGDAMDVLQWAQRAFITYQQHQRVTQFPLELSVNLGVCLLHQGEADKARHALQRLQQHSAQEYGDMFFKVADESMLTSTPDYAMALEYLNELLSHNARYDQPSVWLRVAQCHRALHHASEAIDWYQRVFDAIGDVEACVALVELVAHRGEHTRALQLADQYFARSLPTQQQQQQRTLDSVEIRLTVLQAFSYYQLSDYARFVDAALRVLLDARLVFFRKRKYRSRTHHRSAPFPVVHRHVELLELGVAEAQQAQQQAQEAEANVEPEAERIAAADDDDDDHNTNNDNCDHGDDKKEHREEAEELHTLKSEFERGTTPQLPPQNIIEIVGFDEYLRLVFATCKSLLWLRRATEAFRVIRVCMAYILGDATVELDAERENMLRYLAARVAYHANEYYYAARQMRVVCPRKPYNVALWNHFYKVVSQGGEFTVSVRYLERLLVRFPECVPLRLLVGHHAAMSSSYSLALAEYFPAFRLRPNNPTVCLSIGLAYLNQCMSRRVPDRHFHVMLAFAFLWRYAELAGWTQEVYYNLGRAFQQLALYHFAIAMYVKALNDFASPPPPSTPLTNAEPPILLHTTSISDLRQEIAYNLALTYQASGAPHLARELLYQHLVVRD